RGDVAHPGSVRHVAIPVAEPRDDDAAGAADWGGPQNPRRGRRLPGTPSSWPQKQPLFLRLATRGAQTIRRRGRVATLVGLAAVGGSRKAVGGREEAGQRGR